MRWKTFYHALAFVAGFSLVFILGWGGAATLIGQVFGQYKSVLGQVGGVVVILFGLSNIWYVRIPWFYYDTRPQLTGGSRLGLLTSGLMGVFFAAGWTPCIGATLGAILTLGMSQQTSEQAMLLSSGYALGLGLPFLILGLLIDRATRILGGIKPHLRRVQVVSGIFLVLIGLLMLTNRITLIAIWAQRNRLFLDLPLGSSVTPTYIVAILAGLFSFLSPCVLPLVPGYLGYLSGQVVRTP